MPPTDNPKINDDVFDADENSVDYDNTCSPTPELDPKRDPAPLQSQGIGKQQRCAHCGNLRHRFPRTFAITFQVFLLSYGVNQLNLFIMRFNLVFCAHFRFILFIGIPTPLLAYCFINGIWILLVQVGGSR